MWNKITDRNLYEVEMGTLIKEIKPSEVKEIIYKVKAVDGTKNYHIQHILQDALRIEMNNFKSEDELIASWYFQK